MSKSKLIGMISAVGLLAVAAPAFAAGGFAAIVFDPASGSWGSFYGAYSRGEAEQNAMAECGAGCAGVDVYSLENGSSALKETWVYNGWIAYAKGYSTWATSGIHTDEYSAEQTALANCGGEAAGCQIIRSVSAYDGY